VLLLDHEPNLPSGIAFWTRAVGSNVTELPARPSADLVVAVTVILGAPVRRTPYQMPTRPGKLLTPMRSA